MTGNVYGSHLKKDLLLLVFLAIAFFSVCLVRKGNSLPSAISSDVKGYYMYLPAIFVHGIHHLPKEEFMGSVKNETGEIYTKYTYGTSFFYLPFFLCAHAYAHMTGADTSGFSNPYYYAMMLGGVFWSIIGIYYLRKLLYRYFSRATTWITLLAIVLGTNYFNYATLENGMSHIYSYALFALILLYTDNYYAKPTTKQAIILSMLFALMVVIRPTNMVMAIFPFLFRVTTAAGLKERLGFFKTHFMHFVVAVPFCVIVLLPQLAYWKSMTGHWITYSYENEHFIYWSAPKIARVLFDTRNGLFIYSPTLVFSFWALIARRKDPRVNFAGTLIVFSIITYTFASWWAYWFGAAYGHRCYVEYYTLFAFPVAITVERMLIMQNKALKGVLFFFLAVFCYYTIFYSELYMKVGVFDGPEWEWNWDTWLKYVRMMFGLPPIQR